MALKKDSSSKAEAKAKAKLAKAQAKVAKAEAKAAKAEAKAARAEAKAKGLAAEAKAHRSPAAAAPAAAAVTPAPAAAAPTPAAQTPARTPVRKPIPGPRPLPTLAEARAAAKAAAAAAAKPAASAKPAAPAKPTRKVAAPRPLPTLEHARASAKFKVLLSNTDRSRDISQPLSKLAPEEQLKVDSDYLKGGIEDDLIDEITLAVDENNNKLMKFHGIYMQDHRDHRDERRRQKLEPEYTFMLRARLPGGVCSPEQWLKIDELGRKYGGDTVRLTTRQTFQFHYLHRNTLRDVMVGLRDVGLDSKAACGDVARTVMSGVHPGLSSLHKEVYEWANATSDHAIHRTSAYEEVWFGEKPKRPRGENEEPFYGRQYMPRKFKIGFAIPPSNDIDIYSQDIGFIAVAEGGKLKGFNVAVGGGMGRTDRAPETYPRLGDVIGYIDAEHTLAAVDAIMGVQRDFGARDVRAHSRFKYTVDDKGVDWIKAAIEDRLGFQFGPVADYAFTSNGDLHGWTSGDDGLEHYTMWLENGRIINHPDRPIMDGLRAIAESGKCTFRMTPNQSLILSDIAPADKPAIIELLHEYKLDTSQITSGLRANSMACVAMPTCALAMAESERYLPELITKIEGQLETHGLIDEPITIRMTGCPNGCARPYIAEIALTGRAPGKYNLYLGAGHHGERLNKMLLENEGEEKILATLDSTFAAYAKDRQPGEHYGDFVIRAGIVEEVTEGRFFND